MAKVKIFGKLAQLVTTRDAWYNVGYYIKPNPAAWVVRGFSALSEAQKRVASAFAEVQIAANKAGLDRWQRRELTARVMRGKSFGGVKVKAPKRTPVPAETLSRAISEAEAIVRTYAR